MAGSYHHLLDVRSQHLAVQAQVNGSVVVDAWDARARVALIALDPYVVEDNQLELLLAPLDLPLLASLDPPPRKLEPSCTLRLYRGPRNEAPIEVHLRLGWEWTERECALSAGGLTVVVDHRFRVADPPRWGWEGAQRFGHSDTAQVLAAALLVHEALAERDLGMLETLLSRKLTELGLGWEMPRAEVVDALHEELAMVLYEDDFSVAPMRLDDLRLEPRLDGRLVHVLGPRGRAPIVATGGGRVVTLPLGLACIEEQWVVVR